MKEMKTISFNGQQYEIVDAKAREDIANLTAGNVETITNEEIDNLFTE